MAMPVSHFPTICVEYDAERIISATPVIFLGMPAYPPTRSAGLWTLGSALMTFTCTGARPVWMAHRVGEQNLWTSAVAEGGE
eukprot:COSAG02_NODE_947_length_15716_cov_7.567971_12_plen_82_part_00